MEIHAPDHPITGWKDAAKHLTIITAGVFIALAFEGIVSWADHRLLVREATANVIAELRTNKKELDGLFAHLEQEKAQLEHADEVATLLLAHKPLDHMTFALESHGAELKNAAVTTGQITGAFGYMEYRDVRRYADVYDLQAQLHAPAGARRPALFRRAGVCQTHRGAWGPERRRPRAMEGTD